MKIVRFSDSDFEKQLESLFNRTAFEPKIEESVAKILADIRKDGDKAITKYAKKFDHVSLKPKQFRVAEKELEEAESKIPASLAKAIRKACRQIKDFSRQRIPKAWSYSPRKGVILGERFAPLQRIGAYVPGGTAPLVSTVLHTVTLADAAEVPEIVVITPAQKDGSVNPAILYAASYAGATEIYRTGGVYGIGALAFGTETIPKVEKIVGPGNAYVTAAKRQVYGYVSLDQVAGPSEIMIIADETADPRFIAADMLSQAEHGSGHEQAVLVTIDPTLVDKVKAELKQQTAERNRSECIEKVLINGVYIIVAKDRDHAAELAGKYAPEHLEIMVSYPGNLAKKVTAAGAIFLGPWTPEPVGDFVAGPSHVLPTGGAAKYFSGLTVESFFRRMSIVNYQKSALKNELSAVEEFARAEGLDAHGNSASIRFEQVQT